MVHRRRAPRSNDPEVQEYLKGVSWSELVGEYYVVWTKGFPLYVLILDQRGDYVAAVWFRDDTGFIEPGELEFQYVMDILKYAPDVLLGTGEVRERFRPYDSDRACITVKLG